MQYVYAAHLCTITTYRLVRTWYATHRCTTHTGYSAPGMQHISAQHTQDTRHLLCNTSLHNTHRILGTWYATQSCVTHTGYSAVSMQHIAAQHTQDTQHLVCNTKLRNISLHNTYRSNRILSTWYATHRFTTHTGYSTLGMQHKAAQHIAAQYIQDTQHLVCNTSLQNTHRIRSTWYATQSCARHRCTIHTGYSPPVMQHIAAKHKQDTHHLVCNTSLHNAYRILSTWNAKQRCAIYTGYATPAMQHTQDTRHLVCNRQDTQHLDCNTSPRN